MTPPASRQRPEWVDALAAQGLNPVWTRSGHAWIRIHRVGFMRYPPNDVAPVTADELREMHRRAAPVLSFHREPREGEVPNSVLYLCRDREYDLDTLSANNRSKVRRGLKQLVVRRASPAEIRRGGYRAYIDANSRHGIASMSANEFTRVWEHNQEGPHREFWATFAGDDIAAFGEVRLCGRWAELVATCSADEHLGKYPNHVLFFTILKDLMGRGTVDSVSYGLSSAQQTSDRESLDQFKRSVGLEAIPVIRTFAVHPILRPFVSTPTLRAVRSLQQWRPESLALRIARGSLEMILGEQKATGELDAARTTLPLAADQAAAFAALHRRAFPHYSSSRLGQRFVTAQYRAFATHAECFGFGVWNGKALAGLVVACPADVQVAINHELRFAGAMAAALRPMVLVNRDTLSRAWQMLRARVLPAERNGAAQPDADPALARRIRLVLIAVDEANRGTGVVGVLLTAFSDEARRRRYRCAELLVDETNPRARAAYERAGWTIRSSSAGTCVYEVSLTRSD